MKKNCTFYGINQNLDFYGNKERSAEMSRDDKMTFSIKVLWSDLFQNLLYMVPGMPKPFIMIRFIKKKVDFEWKTKV